MSPTRWTEDENGAKLDECRRGSRKLDWTTEALCSAVDAARLTDDDDKTWR